MRALGIAIVAAALAASCTRGPAPVTRTTTTAGMSACAACHPAIADEWRSSFHRVAFTDATFQQSLALEEPKEHAFCTGCHAPAFTAGRAGKEDGVDCRSCHPVAHERPAAEARRAAEEACARCHEFTFDRRPDLVQKTFSEHATSDFAAVGCAECHLPSRDGHRDHRFIAGHAPDRIARAVGVEVSRSGADVHVTIRPATGHFFPTGDMFRRARLQVFVDGRTGAVIASAERTFGRTWGNRPDGLRIELSDTRIRKVWSEDLGLEADLAGSPDPPARVRWSLLFERVIASRGPHVAFASSDVVAEGERAW